MTRAYRAVLVGCGNIGAGFASDTVMARHVEYSCHAQVLAAHPRLEWIAAVDPDPAALARVAEKWEVPLLVGDVAELPSDFSADVAVLATPPTRRANILDALPGLSAVVAEKPLGTDLAASRVFVEDCARRNIKVQVNFWRRGDALLRELASGRMRDLVGEPYAVFGVYGNGLMNNGSHMIDMVRMLFGEIDRAAVLDRECAFVEGPIPGDKNLPFKLIMASGLPVVFQAIPFTSYRENSLDIWGDKGRLSIMQEGLAVMHCKRTPNRAITDEWEVASDRPAIIPHTCGTALYGIHDDLVAAVDEGDEPCSSGDSALAAEAVVHQLLDSC